MLIDGCNAGISPARLRRAAQGRCRRRDGDLRLLGRHRQIPRFDRPLARPRDRQQGPRRHRHDGGRDRGHRRLGPHGDHARLPELQPARGPDPFVELFAELGVRAIQLTYNNQNELGGSCYEDEDSGLSRTGKEIVREMNRTGILVDLSHVGNRTTKDAILYSEKPVAVTHANPDSLFAHKRNKTDDVLKALPRRRRAGLRHLPQHHGRSLLQLAQELVRDGGEVGRDRGHRPRRHRHRPQSQFHQAGLRLDAHGPVDARHRLWRGLGRAAGQGAATAWFTEVHHLGLLPGGLRDVGFSPPRSRRSPAATGSALSRRLRPAEQAEDARRSSCKPIRCSRRRRARPPRERGPGSSRRRSASRSTSMPISRRCWRIGSGEIAGVNGGGRLGAMTIDGYTLAAKSVYRPEALIAWMDEHRVERAWISIPPPLYRLGLDEGGDADMDALRQRRSRCLGREASRPAGAALSPAGHCIPLWRPRWWRRGRRPAARFAMPAGSQDHKVILSDPPSRRCGRR